jgi:Derlin-2/3
MVIPQTRIREDTNYFLVWYFFNDVYPPLHNGSRPLDPPNWWIRLFEERRDDEDVDEVEDTNAAAVDNDIAAAGGPEFVELQGR